MQFHNLFINETTSKAHRRLQPNVGLHDVQSWQEHSQLAHVAVEIRSRQRTGQTSEATSRTTEEGCCQHDGRFLCSKEEHRWDQWKSQWHIKHDQKEETRIGNETDRTWNEVKQSAAVQAHQVRQQRIIGRINEEEGSRDGELALLEEFQVAAKAIYASSWCAAWWTSSSWEVQAQVALAGAKWLQNA